MYDLDFMNTCENCDLSFFFCFKILKLSKIAIFTVNTTKNFKLKYLSFKKL